MKIGQIKDFILDTLFPRACFGCQKEGDFLCPDCLATLEILNAHKKHSTQNLSDLYFALPYQNITAKRLIRKFKYEPLIKELSQDLAHLIITHLQLTDNVEKFSGFVLVPIPLTKRRQKWRGFNQSEEIAKKLAEFLKIEVCGGLLFKTKETRPQTELSENERKENLKGIFLVNNEAAIENKKILLIDDVYTTGSTMEECARVLKKAGASKIVGLTVARASPEEDCY